MSKSTVPSVKPPPKNDVVGSELHELVRKTATGWRPKEEQFRLFVESVQDYAIFMLDPLGHVCTWNSGAERIKGYKASEVIGRHFSCFYRDQDVRAGKPTRLLKVAAAKGQLRDEGWRVRKDGSIFWAIVTLTAIRDDTGKLIAFGKVTRDVTERMQAEESLREVSGDLLEAHEEERRRIGRDLHDSLGQTLALMKINLDQIAAVTFSEKSETSPKITECVHLAEESIKEVRTISHLFYPPMLEEMGLKSAIPGYLEGFKTRSGIDVTFDVSPNFCRLSRDAELALFRVLQESLTNVHRHSGSSSANIRLSTSKGIAALEIEDQGKGIPSTILDGSSGRKRGPVGVGLRGMKERMRQLGGTLDVVSTEHGAKVIASVQTMEPAASPKTSA